MKVKESEVKLDSLTKESSKIQNNILIKEEGKHSESFRRKSQSPQKKEKMSSEESRKKLDLFSLPNNDFEVEIEAENSLNSKEEKPVREDMNPHFGDNQSLPEQEEDIVIIIHEEEND